MMLYSFNSLICKAMAIWSFALYSGGTAGLRQGWAVVARKRHSMAAMAKLKALYGAAATTDSLAPYAFLPLP